MGMFATLDASASALEAERLRLEVHLSNLANQHTTRTALGGPYTRREVVFSEQPDGAFAGTLAGVRAEVVPDNRNPPRLAFDPGHPDADAKGYVAFPAIDPVIEQAEVVGAARSYEANLAVVRVYKDMLARALEIGR